jgi:hypothetical protein
MDVKWKIVNKVGVTLSYRGSFLVEFGQYLVKVEEQVNYISVLARTLS